MLEELKTRSLKGLAWATGENFGVALISFGSFVVLARLLSPQDFGIVALAGVFIFFCNLLTGHSFADVLVQRPTVDDDHFDTAFWSTLAIAATMTAVLVAGAEPIAALLDEPALAGPLRWLSLLPLINALSSVQVALLRRRMRFDVVARVTLLGRTIGASVGIGMALAGMGYWSLVGQQLAGQLVMMAMFVSGSWRPRFRFSRERFRDMWAFGAQVSASQVLTGAAEQTFILLIGTIFGTTILGFFTLAWRAVQLVRSLIASSVYHVGLNAFSRLQDDREAVTAAFLNATRISCLVGFPVGVGLLLVGEPLILVTFEDRWRDSIPLLGILALEMVPIFYCVFLSALYRAMNRPGWHLLIALLYAAVGLGAAIAAASFGIEVMVIGWTVRSFLLVPVHLALVRRMLGAPVGRLLSPVVAPLGGVLAMAAGLVGLRMALPPGLPPLAELAVLVPTGALIYGAAIWLLSPHLLHLAFRTAGRVVAPAHKSS